MQARTLVIAEAGVNHNGDIGIALKLVDMAADAGADFVKFQTFSADRLATKEALKADYQAVATGSDESQQSMLRRLELGENAYVRIIERCREREISFLSTGFDIESVDFLIGLGLPIIKIPSGELTNLPYLRHVARLGLPVIMSTGMAEIEEVAQAITALKIAGLERKKLTLLHCTTEYPAPFAGINLHAMIAMRKAFGVEVGYSDHTLGIEVAVAAVAMGARVIEKHFTLNRELPGPDHLASLTPSELKEMIRAIRNVELALGDGKKQPSEVEGKNKRVVRKSIVASRPICAGEVFSVHNLTVKRPGTGISPMRWDELIGQPAMRAFNCDEMIEL